MSDKTKKPSGLSITRKGNKFSFSWKIADKDYDNGQQLYCTENISKRVIVGSMRQFRGGFRAMSKTVLTEAVAKKTNISITKKATGASITVNFSNYYPTTNKKLKNVRFYVRGNRSSYTHKGKKINPGWSDWNDKTFEINPPKNPQITINRTSANNTTFSWTVPNADNTGHYPTIRCEWQTLFLKDNNTTVSDAHKLAWSNATKNEDDGATGSESFTEDSALFNGRFSYTRWIRVCSLGPGGPSDWVYKKCTYANPNAATNMSVIVKDQGNGHRITTKWSISKNQRYPLDNAKVRYAIVAPNVTTRISGNSCISTIGVPDSISWQDAPNGTINDTEYSDAWTYDIDSHIPENQCFFGMIDSIFSYWTVHSSGEIGRINDKKNADIYGRLSVPDISTISISESENIRVLSIKVTNNASSSIPNSFVGVYFKKNNNNADCIGVIPAGETEANNIILPEYDSSSDKIAIGIRAYVATYSPLPWSGSISTTEYTKYSITDTYLQSDINWHDGAIPKPPTLSLLPKSSTSITASWDWVWPDANSAELSWADHADAWESTDGPQTYTIENTRATKWNIAGLDVGEWWVRVRLLSTDSNSTVYGLYSAIKHINLASAPSIPSLLIQPSNVTVDGSVSCSWAYVTADGTNQMQADICTATVSESGEITYGDIIYSVNGTNQNASLNSSYFDNWEEGTTINLCVQVRSASGALSDGWSVPQSFTIVRKPSIAIDDQNTSIVVQDVVIDEGTGETIADVPCITDFPIIVSYTGATETDIVTASIVRREAYYDETPDEDIFHGFIGETVVQGISGNTLGRIEINRNDLLRKLDDGGKYTLTVSITDSYGQVNTDSRSFDVHWSHQAKMPTAIVEIDQENYICKITPNPPTLDPGEEYDYSEDRCDIYRLSVDKPQLIYENAEFGIMYVDPFPSLGDFGGHRIVYKTKNGDYTTKDNQYAWENYTSVDDDTLNLFATIIDFDGDKVILPYDISLSTRWAKDFKETKYLGGTIRGDWNPGVSRTASVKTRVAIEEDPDTVEAMRRLGAYAGVCNVRTPDGASYHANVEVSEDREEKWINRLVTFSLEITRVDSDILDGLTYDQWVSGGE